MSHPRPHLSTAAASVAAGCAVALLVAGCSSSGKDDKNGNRGSTSASKSAATSKAAASPTITQHAVPTQPANNVAKRKQVSVTKCAAVAGGWSASGTAKNTSSKPVSYSITVFFTTNGATVLDYAKTTVQVAAGKSEQWTAKKQFAATKPTLCVVTGVA